jgi:flagellar assembly protein FliH
MALTNLLEDFSPELIIGQTMEEAEEDALEEQKLAAFEKGYTAGWDDALRAQSEDREAISTALVRSIEDLGFSYHEARAQLLVSVVPVLDAVARQIVPAALHDSLVPRVMEVLNAELDEAARRPVELVVAPSRARLLTDLLPPPGVLDVTVVAAPDLDADQAFYRIGQSETELDLSALSASITDAMAAFCHQAKKEIAHG